MARNVKNSLVFSSPVLVAPKEMQPVVDVVLYDTNNENYRDIYYFTPKVIIYPSNSRVLSSTISPSPIMVGINPVDNIIAKSKLNTYYNTHRSNMSFSNSSYFFTMRDRIPLNVSTYRLGVNIFNSKDYSMINTIIFQDDQQYYINTALNVTSMVEVRNTINFKGLEVGTKGNIFFNRFSTRYILNFFTVDNPLEPCMVVANYKLEDNRAFEAMVVLKYQVMSDELVLLQLGNFSTDDSYVKYPYSKAEVTVNSANELLSKFDTISPLLKLEEIYEKGIKWLEYNKNEIAINVFFDINYAKIFNESVISVQRNINTAEFISLSRGMDYAIFLQLIKDYLVRVYENTVNHRDSFNPAITNLFVNRKEELKIDLSLLNIQTLDIPEEDEEDDQARV